MPESTAKPIKSLSKVVHNIELVDKPTNSLSNEASKSQKSDGLDYEQLAKILQVSLCPEVRSLKIHEIID